MLVSPEDIEVSISFKMPFTDEEDLEVLTGTLLSELEDEDVVVGIGALRRNRLGVAFFVQDPSQEAEITDRLCTRIARVWPGARLLENTPPEE